MFWTVGHDNLPGAEGQFRPSQPGHVLVERWGPYEGTGGESPCPCVPTYTQQVEGPGGDPLFRLRSPVLRTISGIPVTPSLGKTGLFGPYRVLKSVRRGDGRKSRCLPKSQRKGLDGAPREDGTDGRFSAIGRTAKRKSDDAGGKDG